MERILKLQRGLKLLHDILEIVRGKQLFECKLIHSSCKSQEQVLE